MTAGGAPLSVRERRSLAAIADVVIPGGTEALPLSATASGAVEDLVAELGRPRARQARLGVRAILLLLDVVSVLRHGRTVGRLAPAVLARYLERWARARWHIPRSLFRVVSSMVTLHYYARPEVLARLGYDPARVLALPLRPTPEKALP